jgi:hypothetical protein
MEGKEKKWKIFFIRITCWVGAILDLLIALALTIYAFSPKDTFINKIFEYPVITEINYAIIAMLNGLMYAWTVLLIWADRKPIERRIILAITAFPGAGGILVFNTIGVCMGNAFIPIFNVIIGTVIVTAFIGSFIIAQKISRKREEKK